jgi:hypothetical protein
MNTTLDFSRLNNLSVPAKHVDGAEGGAKIKEVINHREGEKNGVEDAQRGKEQRKIFNELVEVEERLAIMTEPPLDESRKYQTGIDEKIISTFETRAGYLRTILLCSARAFY